MSFPDVLNGLPVRGVFLCSRVVVLALPLFAGSCSDNLEQGETEIDAEPTATSTSPEPVPSVSGSASLEPDSTMPSATVPDVAELLYEYADDSALGEVMVDETWVYWSNPDAVWRTKKDGSSEERELLRPSGALSLTMGLAQDEQRLYWPDPEGPQRLAAVNKQTLEVSYIEYETIDVQGGALLVDRGYAFIATANCRWLVSVPLNGGADQTWAVHDGTLDGGSTGLAVDENYVYCGTGFADSVYRVSRADGTSVELVPPAAENSRRGVGGVAVDDRFLYWVQTRSTSSLGPILLYRQDKTQPGTGTALFELPEGTLNDRLVLQDSTLYWVNGPLQRFNLEDGEYRYLRERAGSEPDLAIDEEYIYWLSPGQVYRANIAALEAGGHSVACMLCAR